MSFVHLHCHSEYSLLDGANRIEALVRRAAELEQPALALTDHGNLHGAWKLYTSAKKAGVKPIVGMEAYVAPGDRRSRNRNGPAQKPYYHLVLLARDPQGYRNLVKLSSLGFTEGFYTRPRIDRELLSRFGEGLIVSSACMAGELASHLMQGDWEGAREVATWYAEHFPGRYYLEVQAHSTPGQEELNAAILKLAEELGLPAIATNDSHFLLPEDHDAHDVLLCIGLAKDRSDRDRMRYDHGLYFKSAAEVAEVFPGREDLLENTLAIAEQCVPALERKVSLPAFPLPQGVASAEELLVRLATEGAKRRYGDPLPEHVRQRLEYELDVIVRTGYSGYFLIVADFIQYAREKGIPVGPGRGSAAGSLVAYALGITNVCPLRHDLLFERFLNPERVSMPDIDVDFCFERRGEVIEYVREKYGRNAVGQIVTFGTLKSRAAVRDVGRVLGFTPAETDALAKLIPNQPNYSLTVAEAVEKVAEVRRLYETDERYRQLLDYAMRLEGLSRHTGVHAAGVVIAPGPLEDYVPVFTQELRGAARRESGRAQRNGDGEEPERVIVTQFDMDDVADVGLLKMDFLGLTTLTVIHDTLQAIRERTGQAPDLDHIDYEDPEVYRMLRTGRTTGVFQFESPLATDLLRGMRCDRFDDLVASNALMRPGPLDSGMHRVYQRRKRGEEPVTYLLPELEPILRSTYGVITYQEQLMRIAQELAGMSLAEADVLRKAVGKKDAELIQVEVARFVERAVARGYDRGVMEELASQIVTFGRYGFNKSHAVAYSIISYQTAWLKCHYPAEYMAALLSSCIGDTDSVVKYIAEARELGLEVLPPDVNESGYKFTVVGERRIRFGLGAIRNVGRAAIDSILEARAERPFSSLFDLCERVDLRLCNKRVLEALAKSGALDSLGGHRRQYLEALDTALREATLRQEELAAGQGSLFGSIPSVQPHSDVLPAVRTLPAVPPLSESERLAMEKEALGFYISGHPLEPYRAECELVATHTVSQLGTWHDGQVTIAGVVTAIRRQVSRKTGAEFARLTVEDFTGSSEVLVFPETWAAVADRVKLDVPLVFRGGYSRRDEGSEQPTFIVESVQRFEELRSSGQIAVAIELDGEAGDDDYPLTPDVLRDVRAVVESHPGSAPLEVRWRRGPARLRSRSFRVAASPLLLHELRGLLGTRRVRLVRAN
jgi:DNA polymerase-3 subunit alpha